MNTENKKCEVCEMEEVDCGCWENYSEEKSELESEDMEVGSFEDWKAHRMYVKKVCGF